MKLVPYAYGYSYMTNMFSLSFLSVLALFLIFGFQISVAMATSKRRTVIVIGAGMAGLSAAAELSQSDLCDVIVLEAMDQPGGRIQSVKGFGEFNPLKTGYSSLFRRVVIPKVQIL